MCSFNLTVHANEQDLHLTPTSYVELSEVKKVLLKFLQNKVGSILLDFPDVLHLVLLTGRTHQTQQPVDPVFQLH